MSSPVAPEDLSRRQQFVQTYKMAKKSDPRIGLWTLLAFIVGAAIGFGIFWFLPGPRFVFSIPGAFAGGLIAALILFGRRAQAAAYAQMDGQVGAAAASLKMLRRGWQTDPAVAFTKQQDIVHRVVGPPGIVLIGEGNPNRLRPLAGHRASQARAGRERHPGAGDHLRQRRR